MPTLEWVEKDHILRTYREQGSNKTRTAAVLGIAVNTLVAKLEKYGAEGTKSNNTGDGGRLPFYSGEDAKVVAPQPIPAADEGTTGTVHSPKKRASR
jgi:Bacterial regulatory protein, Fis family